MYVRVCRRVSELEEEEEEEEEKFDRGGYASDAFAVHPHGPPPQA